MPPVRSSRNEDETFPMGNGGKFYFNPGLETVVDPFQPPMLQNQMLEELRKCDQLVQLDYRYAKIVQGASKMPWTMVWAARNQDDPVSDTDLAELRNVSWNEIIRKRYLPSLPGTMTVGETTASMLDIVREMNLQRRRFQIMGLHEQVEACEIHLVLQLCQSGILQSDRYRVMANRFRRHDKLFEAFGLAVGAFVCASAPFTLGSGMARYERDLQYEYRKNVTVLFVWVLQQNLLGLNVAAVLDEDYVARISRLIVVWPDEDEGKGRKSRRIGLASSGDRCKGGDGSCCCEEVRNMMLDSIATAQGDADKARIETVRLRERTEAAAVRIEEEVTREKVEIRRLLDEKAVEFTSSAIRDVRELIDEKTRVANEEMRDWMARTQEIMNRRIHDEIRTMNNKLDEHIETVATMKADSDVAVRTMKTDLEQKMDQMSENLAQLKIDITRNAVYAVRTMKTDLEQKMDRMSEDLTQLKTDITRKKIRVVNEEMRVWMAQAQELMNQWIHDEIRTMNNKLDEHIANIPELRTDFIGRAEFERRIIPFKIFLDDLETHFPRSEEQDGSVIESWFDNLHVDGPVTLAAFENLKDSVRELGEHVHDIQPHASIEAIAQEVINTPSIAGLIDTTVQRVMAMQNVRQQVARPAQPPAAGVLPGAVDQGMIDDLVRRIGELEKLALISDTTAAAGVSGFSNFGPRPPPPDGSFPPL